MIIKQVSMKSLSKSSFKNLLGYLTNNQGHSSRVGELAFTNLTSDTLGSGIIEVQKTQRENTRCKSDKTLHLIVSFPDGERVSNDVLHEIEKEVCDALGLGKHQRISVIHDDTDNLHLHIAINKIDPITHNNIDPYQSYKKLSQVASVCEEKYNLIRVNHIESKTTSESKINTMETHRGEESLCSEIRNLKNDLSSASNWKEFHNILAENGLGIKVRANGLVFFNDQGIYVKASTVDRNFSKSKLEKRFGTFIEDDENSINIDNSESKAHYKKSNSNFVNDAEQNLWKEYQELRYKNKKSSEKQSQEKTSDNYEQYKTEAENIYKTIGLEYKIVGMLKMPKFMRAYFNFYLSTMAKMEKEKIKQKVFNQTYHKNQKKQSWIKFLEDKSLNGDEVAMALLKKRQKKTSTAQSQTFNEQSTDFDNESFNENNSNASSDSIPKNKSSRVNTSSSFVIHEDSENFAKFRQVKKQIEKTLKPECITSRGNKIYRLGDSFIKVTDTSIEKNNCNLGMVTSIEPLNQKENKNMMKASVMSEFKKFVREKYANSFDDKSTTNKQNENINNQSNNSFFSTHRVPTTNEIMLDKLESFTDVENQRVIVRTYQQLRRIVEKLEVQDHLLNSKVRTTSPKKYFATVNDLARNGDDNSNFLRTSAFVPNNSLKAKTYSDYLDTSKNIHSLSNNSNTKGPKR